MTHMQYMRVLEKICIKFKKQIVNVCVCVSPPVSRPMMFAGRGGWNSAVQRSVHSFNGSTLARCLKREALGKDAGVFAA